MITTSLLLYLVCQLDPVHILNCVYYAKRLTASDSQFCSFWCFGSILLVSCGEKNLKGSGINKRKAKQTKAQQDFGRHAGSGAVCTHKELSVSPVVLHIPVEYSLSHTLAHTHYNHRHMGGRYTKIKLTWGDWLFISFFFLYFSVHTFVLCFWSYPSSFLWKCCMGFCCKNCFDIEPETRLNQNKLVYPLLLGKKVELSNPDEYLG